MATAVAPRIFRNFINGEWVESRSGKAYEDRNPANTDELVGMFVASTDEDVDAAVEAAAEAYKKWRPGPPPQPPGNLFRALWGGGQPPLFYPKSTPPNSHPRYNSQSRFFF